ncbi:hypothetical protein CK203_008144 [Vitis vinifera]|uniref:Uncharacterized protein n=1 Tax=Vitis vinifera TaxID=29760 RepID=A0A438KNX4_VITVI|nr:hypothetical protein CK203_008144 [Vitis vinifera]
MGAGTARRLMGLSDHAWVTHRKHSVRSCIWHGCSHPHENRKELGKNLDWVDEVRENASIRMVDYQQRAAAHYNCKARPQVFKIGALVFRKVLKTSPKKGAGKFQANWEDPYIISKVGESRAYHL